jgi:hypothetical protein
MRFISFLALAVAVRGASVGTVHPETATYIEGNLTGVAPNTAGTIMFSDGTAMYLRTDSETIPVPYASISKAKLSAPKTNSHETPLHKVSSLSKRLTGKTATKYLTVDFKNTGGEDQTMTLELAQASASHALEAIQSRTAAAQAKESASRNPAKDDWWGDDHWKTTRNASKWADKEANQASASDAP